MLVDGRHRNAEEVSPTCVGCSCVRKVPLCMGNPDVAWEWDPQARRSHASDLLRQLRYKGALAACR